MKFVGWIGLTDLIGVAIVALIFRKKIIAFITKIIERIKSLFKKKEN